MSGSLDQHFKSYTPMGGAVGGIIICRGPLLPYLVTHGAIVSATDQNEMKVLTGTEQLIAIGEPLAPGPSTYPSFVGPAICALPACEKKALAGNSYDTFSWGNFVVYFLANLSLRSDSDSFASSSMGTVGADGDVSKEIPMPFESGEVVDLLDSDDAL